MPRKAKEEKVEIVEKKETKAKVSKVNKTKSNTKKSASSTSVKSKKTTTKTATRKKAVSIVEYYDLPFSYNQTTVKILAQTPNTLFIYWDISEKDKENYINTYGESFFNTTKPVLIITNETMNYTFEVEINDYANSWYLHVTDSNCVYHIELGRRHITYENQKSSNNYVYIASSNKIESPNDHILLDNLGQTVFFRNVKNNFVEEKEISSISYLSKIGKLYNIYDKYKEMYKDELLPSSHSNMK